MNKDMKEAKFWLNRNYLFTRKVMADKRTLERLESQIAGGVAKYESDGTSSGDRDAARRRHEDALIDYSEILSRYEEEERQLIKEVARTRRAIEKLEDPDLIAIATDRYLNLMKWEDIAEAKSVSRAQVFRIHDRMLEKMVKILRTEDL